MTIAFSNSSLKIPKWSIFCPKCKCFLILHEASHIEKFDVINYENGNSFFQIPAKSAQIQIINLLILLLQSYR